MAFYLFDIHSHLTDSAFSHDRALVLERMMEKKVGTISIGVDKESSGAASSLSKEYAQVWACIGLHPEDGALEMFDPKEYETLLHPKVVAVGECGLDYFRSPKEEVYSFQKKQFEMQIEFALEHSLPLMLHIRPSKRSLDAYYDALDILSSYKNSHPTLRGNSHFFAGGTAVAEKLFALDFTISFTGVVTFAREYDEVIRVAPLTHIHTETDSPYVAPVPYKGSRADPTMVEEVVLHIAKLKGIKPNDLRAQLLKNAEKLFGIVLSQ